MPTPVSGSLPTRSKHTPGDRQSDHWHKSSSADRHRHSYRSSISGAKSVNEQTNAMGKQLGMTKEGSKSALELVKAQREWGATQNQLKVATATALLPVILRLTQALMPTHPEIREANDTLRAIQECGVGADRGHRGHGGDHMARQCTGLFTLNAQILLIPALIAGVIIGLIILYQKCAWFRNAVQAVMHGVMAAFNWVKNAAVAVFNWVKGHWPLLVAIIGGPLALAVAEGMKHFDTLKNGAVSVFNKIKGVIGDGGGLREPDTRRCVQRGEVSGTGRG